MQPCQGSALIQQTHVSAQSRVLLADDLRDVLAKSQANNLRDGLTSLLVFSQGTFLQVIEGPADAVNSAMERIREDHRHGNLIKIFEAPVERRSFDEAPMMFVDIDGSLEYRGLRWVADVRQYNDFIEGLRDDRARRLVEAFHDGRWRHRTVRAPLPRRRASSATPSDGASSPPKSGVFG